jgi:D-serine deaminase-like pyridoxal phosphate-dependent protein
MQVSWETVSTILMSANQGAIGAPLSELETPALCLDLDAYRRNLQRMADYIIRRHGLAWRPHMKGQKATELAHEAVAAGACGVTCATLYEAEAMIESGIASVLLAHQVAGARKLARLARLARKGGLIAATDSEEHAAQLNAAAQAEGTAVSVVVEVDAGMQRCGIAPGPAAAALALRIAAMPGLKVRGVMAWEGHAVPLEGEEKRAEILRAIGKLVDSAAACRAAGLAVEIVSAGGSATYLDASPVPGLTEVQAGGGAFCDLNYQRWGLDTNEFALTVLTRIVSRPTAHRIIVDGGFKTMSVQHGPPRPMGLAPLKSMLLTAEHGILELQEPDAAHRVGETIAFIPGYTDSTVCLHDEICVMRGGALEAVWAIPGRTGRR